MAYVDGFGIEDIPEEFKIFICDRNIITNIFRIQTYESTMREYLCIEFIEFMLNGKSLTDFTNLFSPNNFKKNDTMILEYFLK